MTAADSARAFDWIRGFVIGFTAVDLIAFLVLHSPPEGACGSNVVDQITMLIVLAMTASTLAIGAAVKGGVVVGRLAGLEVRSWLLLGGGLFCVDLVFKMFIFLSGYFLACLTF